MDVRATWARLRQRRWVRLGMELAVFAAAALAVMSWQTRDLTAAPLPDLALRTLQGQEQRLSAYRGKPLMLVVWAPWCGVCKLESGSVSLLKRLVGGSAHVVSVATAYEDEEDVRRFMREHDVDYPVLLGGEQAQAGLRVRAFPTLLFLSSEGELRRAAVGYTTLPGMLVRLWL